MKAFLLAALLVGSAIVIFTPSASACTDHIGCNGFGHCYLVWSNTDTIFTPESGVPSTDYPSGYRCVW